MKKARRFSLLVIALVAVTSSFALHAAAGARTCRSCIRAPRLRHVAGAKVLVDLVRGKVCREAAAAARAH